MTDLIVPDYFAPNFRRSNLLRRIADRNPFYLISAACMLGGCLAMTNSLSWNSLPLRRLILLIATLNLYEAGLIAIALLLLARGLLRDGKILLILEAFFLVDVTFLNSEIVTANLRVGLAVNLALLVFAAIKLRLVMRAMGAALPTAKFVYVLLQMTALLLIPCIFRGIDHGSVSPLNFYLAWWVVGMMPALRELTAAIWGRGGESRASGVAAIYLGVPWVSLIAHLGILHYVYDVPFYGAMAAPLLLGLALVMNRALPQSVLSQPVFRAMRVLLPLAAVLVSVNSPHVLAISLGRFSSPLSTLMLGMAGAYLTYIYCFFLPLAGWFLAGGATVAAMALLGPSVTQMESVAGKFASDLLAFANWIVPKTTAGWGVVGVLAAFFFLILGAAISFTRPAAIMNTSGDQTGQPLGDSLSGS